MTIEMVWIAKTEFKYGGKVYKRGEQVEPVGGKWDEKIFTSDSRFVRVEQVNKKPVTRSRRKAGGK